jgi:hypothetical protein
MYVEAYGWAFWKNAFYKVMGTINSKHLVLTSVFFNADSEGVYVRVVGVVRSFNSKFAITIISIRSIHDMNEITYHNLEVMLLHVSSTREKVTIIPRHQLPNSFWIGVGVFS